MPRAVHRCALFRWCVRAVLARAERESPNGGALGIGRTGTLLAVHSFLARHRGDTNVTVREIVEDMRKHRMGMVQTKEQYRFIYQAIEDALKQNSRMGVQPDGESGESSTSQPPKRNWRTRSSPAIRTSAEMGVSY